MVHTERFLYPDIKSFCWCNKSDRAELKFGFSLEQCTPGGPGERGETMRENHVAGQETVPQIA